MTERTIQELAAMNPADAMRVIITWRDIPISPEMDSWLGEMRAYCEQPVPEYRPEPAP